MPSALTATLPRTPSFRLHGRRALVTGAGRGLGLASAAALAEAGAEVRLAARSAHEVQAAAAALRDRGDRAHALVLDVTDTKAAAQAVATHGPFQVLVNNAGTNRPKPFDEVSEDDVAALQALNVKAAFFVARVVARVLKAARKLGYRPNAIASTLSSPRSRMIAVVLSNPQNQFYPVVIEALAQRLQKDGHHVLPFVTETEDADELLVELMRYQADGIVLASTQLSCSLTQQIADARIPVVMFDRTSSKGRISTVSSDNLGGGRAVAHFLADGGHKRVADIAGAEESSTNHDREKGLRAGFAERGLRVVARVVGNYEFERAALTTQELFGSLVASRERSDALFGASDHMAFAAIGLVQQLEADAFTRDHVVVPTKPVVLSSSRLPR